MDKNSLEDSRENDIIGIEDFVINKFERNWAFQLFAIKKTNHWIFALVLPGVIFFVGGLLSALFHVFLIYIVNWTLYLTLLGIALAFIAFGWFTHRLPKLLAQLEDLFESNIAVYKEKIEFWGEFACKNERMLGIGAVISVIYLIDTIKYWGSPNPPILLAPWVNSDASAFFAIFYGFLHVIVVPLILGSGIYGMYGIVRLMGDIFTIPIELVYYRRAEEVVGLTGWLLMWSLIGWSSIVIFGRPLFVFPVEIPWIRTSGLFLSLIVTLFVLAIGSIPLIMIGWAIEKAKREERNYLEKRYQEVDKKYLASVSDENDDQHLRLLERLRGLRERIRWIDEIPTIPIRLSSLLRVSFGVVVSILSPFAQDWIWGYFLSVAGIL